MLNLTCLVVLCCDHPLQSSFIPAAASVQAVRLLQVSANKRYLAAAEVPHGSEQQQVSVYNVPAQKREQTLQLASHTRSNTVTALSFRCVSCAPRDTPGASQCSGTGFVLGSWPFLPY